MSKESRLAFIKRNPWYDCWRLAVRRCSDTRHRSYKKYSEKGIKCFLTKEDAAYLWQRDQAHLLRVPSIDRLDSSKDYTVENCRFMELYDNCMRPHRERVEKTEWTD